MLDEVVGQREAVHVLRRVLEGHLDQPLLLAGVDGVGKRFSIQQFTREYFCTGSRKAGCDCVHCFHLDAGEHPDLITISAVDDKAIGVGFVRDVVKATSTFPVIARRKVIFIDGCDRFTSAAANAFLKTLEEPPSTVRLFLSAQNSHRTLPTIRSRCAVIDYHRLSADFIASRLQQIEPDAQKALVYARLADGSLGRAINFKAQQKLALRDKMLQILSAAASGDIARTFIAIDDLGTDLSLGVTFLVTLVHDLLLLPHDPSRIVNLDAVSAINKARSCFKPGAITLFWERLKVVLDRQERARVNLSFQLKALFVGML